MEKYSIYTHGIISNLQRCNYHKCITDRHWITALQYKKIPEIPDEIAYTARKKSDHEHERPS